MSPLGATNDAIISAMEIFILADAVLSLLVVIAVFAIKRNTDEIVKSIKQRDQERQRQAWAAYNAQGGQQ